ncbi:MAG TPA: LysM domain-containing protein [Candidatus Limnocylindrales bacterium]|nr:LysM domain-containing protein [Candidatus Limnocylindrales bacterium]
MSLRERLGTGEVAATLAIILIALAGLTAIVTGFVQLPSFGDLLGLSGGSGGAAATSAPPPSPTPSPAETFAYPTPSPQATFIQYTVAVGDTLTSIAKKFHTTARSIAWWNRGTYPSLDPQSPNYQPNSIKKGWILVVMPGQVVDENNPPTPSPAPDTPSPTGSAAPSAS